MQALTLIPGVKDSLALRKIPEPGPDQGSVPVEAPAVGLCGTDAEITAGNDGQPPPGHKQLVLEAPPGSGLAPGDLVVGIVRRPDPEPCRACAAGEWDMCLNGKCTEHGIKQLDGFARERWRGEPEDMVKLGPGLADVGVLLEPTAIVAKAWEQIMHIGARAFFDPHVAVVTGAGPVGLLGVRRWLEVHVFDIVSDGPKPGLGRDLGATHHSGTLPESGIRAGILVECTGITDVVLDVLGHRAPDAIACLTGVSGTGKETEVDVGALNRRAVLGNGVTF